MPEEIEVDTDKLREQIDHEIESGGPGRLLRITALTTAMLAAIAAVASLKAGATVNDAILLKTEATQLQSQASDQWAYYQAKGIKGAVAAASMQAWQATGKTPPAELAATVQRYTAQQDSISAAAHALEHERDGKIEEADHLLAHHHAFANAVALLQVAIALGAVAALTRSKAVLGGSWVAGGIGAAIFFMNLATK
jgi:Domain of unknown function (DUF4337)